MEYRYFYPISAETFKNEWKTHAHLKDRTDIYFLFPTDIDQLDQFHIEQGLKLRNKKKLELKKREQRSANGQEYWKKSILSTKSFHPEQIDAIVDAIKTSNEYQLIQRLLSAKTIILCYVSKYRRQHHVGNNLVQEFAGFKLRFIRSIDQIQIGDDRFFETVCIEPLNGRLIDEKIIEKLLQERGDTSVQPMGYPEFLFRQYQQIINN